MKIFKHSLTVILGLFVLLTISCNKDDEGDVPDTNESETGTLVLNLGISVEESSGRLDAVDIDNFIVNIISADLEDTITFNPWSSAPAEIELETGEYYVDAQNIYPAPAAAFESPWYYGKSDNFTIDKEEIETIDITCVLANYKVSFNYSTNVTTDFTSWNAKATRSISGEYLEWPMNDDREGYFITGESLAVEVHLAYDKQFDGNTITRDFFTTIDLPKAATLYKINIDAALQDGQIVIVINVDDGFEVVEIDLTASLTFTGPGTYEEIPGGATVAYGENNPEQGFGKSLTSWELSNVLQANTKTVLWGPTPNGIKGSMDDDVFQDGSPNEILDFDPVSSDLSNGYMVFTGSTIISLAISPGSKPVDLLFEINVTDKVSGTPIALVSSESLGLPPSIGGLAEFNSSADVIEVAFVLKAKDQGADPSTYLTFLNYYDAAATIQGNFAYSSYSGGFYWSNLDK